MKFSLSFLGTDVTQLPLPGTYGNEAVEAIIFNRKDLKENPWNETWKSIRKAISLYGSDNVSFHFPVSNSDYIREQFVRERVAEGLRRSNDLGLRSMVIHSNQMSPIAYWQEANFEDIRKQIIDILANISSKHGGKTWLTLENMPVMDNDGAIIDPLFVFPSDFQGLLTTNVKVVWDICHYTNSITNIGQVVQGKQKKEYYPNFQQVGLLDFLKIKDLIVHWHFSAFKGIANPDTDEITVEGFVPAKSTLGEELYDKIIKEIFLHQSPGEHMVFEVQEIDYHKRIEGKKMIQWAKSRGK